MKCVCNTIYLNLPNSDYSFKLRAYHLIKSVNSIINVFFRYDLDENNCYDFVLGFLCRLKLNDKDASLGSRLKFCEDKLVPKMRQVAKYINLLKEVLQKGSVVQGQISSTSL